MRKLSIALGVFLVGVCIASGLIVPIFPRVAAPVVEGMDALKHLTPPGSMIWTWWDNGYPVQFYAERGTAGDGGINDGELCYYTGIPLVTNSQRMAANFITMYSAIGRQGVADFCADAVTAGATKDDGMACLKRALAVGPQDASAFLDEYKLTDKWLKKLYPKDHRPVYLFLDYRLTQTSYWWFHHGSWVIDEQRGIHPSYLLLLDLEKKDNLLKCEDAVIDFGKGRASVPKFKKSFLVKKIIENRKGKITETQLNEKGLEVYWIPDLKIGALMSEEIGKSTFNQLFMLHEYSDYFKPVRLRTPFYQIWQVKGDEL